ncbi:MAG: helix-hairpin-helix domain-containing protein [Bacteroidota bacterium]
MYLFLQADESILGATVDVAFYTLIAFGLASLFWYFYQKKDKKTIETLSSSLKTLQPKHDVLSNQYEHLKAEHLKLKEGLADLMENYQTLHNEHEAFLVAQSSAKNVYEQADEERLSLLDSYESMESNYNALETKYNDVVNSLDRLEEEIDTLKDERDELQEVNAFLRSELKKLEEILAAKGEDIAAIRSEFEDGSQDFDDEIEKLIGASNAQPLVRMLPEEEKKVDVSEAEATLRANYDSLKADYHQLRNENEEWRIRFHALQNDYEALVGKQSSIDETNKQPLDSDWQSKYDALQQKFTAVSEELNQKVLPKLRATQSLLNQKEQGFRELQAKLEDQTNLIQSSSSQLKNFEDVRATNQALYTSNKNLAEKNTALQKQYEKINGEYLGMKSQFQLLREQFSVIENRLELAQEKTSTEELNQAYDQLKVDYLVATEAQSAQQEKIEQLEKLLHSINESSSYGIIYLPSNLQIIEGIGPKIEQRLLAANIRNWEELANTEVAQLKAILKEAGRRFQVHDPTTWPQQAQLLASGQWKAFRDLEAEIIAGKKRNNKEQIFDDLKVIEGIGPKIEVLLNNANIHTWKKLSTTGIGELKKLLKTAGSSYEVHDPSSWPEQAKLAAAQSWNELKTLKETLQNGQAEA